MDQEQYVACDSDGVSKFYFEKSFNHGTNYDIPKFQSSQHPDQSYEFNRFETSQKFTQNKKMSSQKVNLRESNVIRRSSNAINQNSSGGSFIENSMVNYNGSLPDPQVKTFNNGSQKSLRETHMRLNSESRQSAKKKTSKFDAQGPNHGL